MVSTINITGRVGPYLGRTCKGHAILHWNDGQRPQHGIVLTYDHSSYGTPGRRRYPLYGFAGRSPKKCGPHEAFWESREANSMSLPGMGYHLP